MQARTMAWESCNRKSYKGALKMACVLFSSLPLIPVWRDIVSCHSSALHFDLNLQFAFDGLRQVVSSKLPLQAYNAGDY